MRRVVIAATVPESVAGDKPARRVARAGLY